MPVENLALERTGYSLRKDGPAVACLLALAVLYFLPVLLKGDRQVLSNAGNDVWGAYYYWRHFGFDGLRRGEVPLWNPYSFSGLPFVAGMESAIFYPPNILHLAFGTAFSINLSMALHCFLAGLYTYLFARYLEMGRAGSLFAAIVFGYGATCVLRIYAGHLVGLSALIWLPLLFMSAEAFLRKGEIRYALSGGIVFSLQFLAGQPQYLFYSAIAVSFYFFVNLLMRRALREAPYFLAGFCLLVLTGVSLSAIQFLPALELARYSVRDALSYAWVSSFSLPPENLITLLVPDFFGDHLTVPYWGKNFLWEMSIYLGVIPLILAATAMVFDRSRPVLIFSSIAALSLVMALGEYTPLLGFVYAYVPGFNLFRGPSKFGFVFSFACSMLAGYGFKKFAALTEERDPRLRYLSYGLFAAALLSALLAILGPEAWAPLVRSYRRAGDYFDPIDVTEGFLRASLSAVSKNLFKVSAILLLFGGLSLGVVRLRMLSTKLFLVALSILTALDLWSFGSRYLVTFSPDILSMDGELKAFLKNDKEPFRIATQTHVLLNVGFLEGIKNVGGYDQLTLKNYNEFINFSQGLPLDDPNFVMTIDRASPLLALLNVRYYVFDRGVSVRLPGLHPAFQNSRYKVYRDAKALSRSFVVHEARVVEGREAALEALAQPTFDPRAVALVDEPVEGLPAHPAPAESPAPDWIEDSPNKVRLEADLKEAGLLVLGDVYYPGWKAFVDGREARIYRVNYVVRGVFLPKGQHVVEFRYDPLSFKIGAAVSLTSLMIVLAILFRSMRGSAKFSSRPSD